MQHRALSILYVATVFLGALLLFSIQPLFSKMVLPVLGGAPTVWITALVFFQGLLLGGYLYAHLGSRWLTARQQALLHLFLMSLAALLLPVGLASGWDPPDSATPGLWLLGLFAASVGLPYFVIAATAPLTQHWFSLSAHAGARDPYFLYAASNAGALLALLSYPVALEPFLGLTGQSRLWTAAYLTLAILLAACAWWLPRRPSADRLTQTPASSTAAGAAAIGWNRRLFWLAQSFVPSVLLLGVTLHISTDVAAVPFLWVVPLAVYLLSFVLVFARRPPLRRAWMIELQAWVFIALAIYFASPDIWLVFGLHLLVLAVTSMVCHGELARTRPAATGLTEFYLWISLGGFLGGVFSALLAPVLFDAAWEYPAAILLAALLRPRGGSARAGGVWRDLLYPAFLLLLYLAPGLARPLHPASYGPLGPLLFYTLIAWILYGFRKRPLRLALGLAVLILGARLAGESGNLVARERSFFGVYEVRDTPDGQARVLYHGSTVHGAQILDPAHAREPLTYYNRSGPLGQVFDVVNAGRSRPEVGVLGLGAGTLACYARPGQHFTFYEIDPTVAAFAGPGGYFSYLRDCAAISRVVIGDGRRKIAGAPDAAYGLLVLDAFSSDAVPLHLLTREAWALYMRKLAPGGLLMVNVSNRYVDLQPPIAGLCRNAGLVCRVRKYQPSEAAIRREGAYASDWLVVARDTRDLGSLAVDPRWRELSTTGTGRLWTDDYANLFSVLRWGRLLWTRDKPAAMSADRIPASPAQP